jgi:hypothetical protein
MRSFPQQQQRPTIWKYRYLLDLALLGLLIYGIWLLVSGRLNMPFGATFTQQQKIVKMYDFRTEYNADVSALRSYRNELANTGAGARRDEIVSNMQDAARRCQQAVAGYDDLARNFTHEYLVQQNVPEQLDNSQCSAAE